MPRRVRIGTGKRRLIRTARSTPPSGLVGQDIAKIEAVINPEWDDTLPPGWPIGAMLGLNFGIPLPAFTVYAFEIMIDDNSLKSLGLRVVERPAAPPPA